jgi:hypothetical protein
MKFGNKLRYIIYMGKKLLSVDAVNFRSAGAIFSALWIVPKPTPLNPFCSRYEYRISEIQPDPH